jgi:glutamate racemase
MAKIGVFDSGAGGLSVAKAIEKAFPNDTITYVNDKAHLPYGDKTPRQIITFMTPILTQLVADGCEVIVIACNTATTTVINDLRKLCMVPLIGIEPMVKPAAAQTKTGIIAVCATPGTLTSPRYQWLKDTYASDVTVLEPDCSTWASMIEHNQVQQEYIAAEINEVCGKGADVIVLACTHYHWIESLVKQLAADRATVIQPEPAIIRQLGVILGR